MASVAHSQLSKGEHDELCCIYSALLLHDEGIDVDSSKINKLISVSGNEVEKYWPVLFANALKGKNISDLLTNLGSGGGPSAQEGAPQETAGEATKEEEKKEEEEEEAMEGAMDLFGGDDDW